MDSKAETKKFFKQMYYFPSVAMIIITLMYCTMVYLAGEFDDSSSGYMYLIGIPNYYFFYLSIFPFVTAGIMYIATQNKNVRFFGKLNEELAQEQTDKILFYRKLLLVIAFALSLAITINDASDKGHTLPPYSISLASDKIYMEATHKFFELKKLENERRNKASNNKENLPTNHNENNIESTLSDGISLKNTQRDFDEEYFNFIKQKGYQGDSGTGFQSLSSWFSNASFIYKVESLLSLIAAFVMAIFFAQFFLFIMVKEHILSETKNLVLWLVILCSLWIPCKIFSVYYYSLKSYQPPAIVWFATLILVIGIMLALFIKVEKNDMSKYATLVVAVFSFTITSISIFKPEYFELALKIVQQLGWMYVGILLFLMSFSIFLVTDHLISTYEKSKDTKSAPATDNSDTPEAG